MNTIKYYWEILEGLNHLPCHPDSYTPYMGDFSLDITRFLDGAMEAIFSESQRNLINYLPASNTYHLRKLPLLNPKDCPGDFNSTHYINN
jgi:hypothetical protein